VIVLTARYFIDRKSAIERHVPCESEFRYTIKLRAH